MTRQEALAIYRRHGLLLAQVMGVREDIAAKLAELEAERDKARADYQFMVERAADQRLDGYHELGARAAAAENERDTLRARVAELEKKVGLLDTSLAFERVTIAELKAEAHQLRVRRYEQEERIKQLEAPPVVPAAFEVSLDNIGSEDAPHLAWVLSDMLSSDGETPNDLLTDRERSQLAQAHRALAWAIETGKRPPHEGEQEAPRG